MNATILSVAQDLIVLRCGWTLVHFLWQASIVAIGLAAMLRILRNPNSRYFAGCVALVALTLLPVVTFIHLEPPETAIATSTTSQAFALTPDSTLPNVDEELKTSRNRQDSLVANRIWPSNTITMEAAPLAREVSRWIETCLPMLTLSWAFGVFLMAAYLVISWVSTAHAVRSAIEPSPKGWQQKTYKAAKQLGIWRTVRLLQTDLFSGPVQIGWLRPIVLVPASMLTNLAPQELEVLLLHELAHIRRHDYLINVLQRIIETLFFYHPVVWWVSRVVRTEREDCCDDIAMEICGQPHIYTSALAAAEQLKMETPSFVLGATDGSLAKRIQRIYDRHYQPIIFQDGSRNLAAIIGLVMFLVLPILFVAALPGITSVQNMISHVAQNVPLDSQVLWANLPYDHISIFDLPECKDRENLGEVDLPRNGQVFVSGRFTSDKTDKKYQEFLVRLNAPSHVVIQVISKTNRFRPFLVTSWPTQNGPDTSDSDFNSGRDSRPMILINNHMPAPENWLHVKVWSQHSSIPEYQLIDDHGDYIVHVRQPTIDCRDRDPNTLGVHSSPIVLDPSGYGRVHPGKNGDLLPAIDYGFDADTFQVRAVSGSPLSLTVDGTVGEVNTLVKLYDGNHKQIDEAPTGAPQRRIMVSVKKPKPGAVYYLAVSSYDDETEGLYIVQAQQQPSQSLAKVD